MKLRLILFFTFLFSLPNYFSCKANVPFDFERTELSNELRVSIENDNLTAFQEVYKTLNMPKQLYPLSLSDDQEFLMCKLLICASENRAIIILNYLFENGGECCRYDQRVQEAMQKYRPFNIRG